MLITLFSLIFILFIICTIWAKIFSSRSNFDIIQQNMDDNYNRVLNSGSPRDEISLRVN